MAEYGGKQRKKLSKVIGDSESRDVQLKRFIDDRPQTKSQMNLIRSIQKKPNNTGLLDNLKSRVENLSGYSMHNVKVHYNSDKPAQLQALAYTQGTDIHVAPAQEKHLPHEAWHVVQQKQRRVQPTMQLQDVNINNNVSLEKEADFIRSKTFQVVDKHNEIVLDNNPLTQLKINDSLFPCSPMQLKSLDASKLNVCGEDHNESNQRRSKEIQYTKEKTGGIYKRESEFRTRKSFFRGNDKLGDPLMLRSEMLLALLKEKSLPGVIVPFSSGICPPIFNSITDPLDIIWDSYRDNCLIKDLKEICTSLYAALQEKEETDEASKAENVYYSLDVLCTQLATPCPLASVKNIEMEIKRIISLYAHDVLEEEDIRSEAVLMALRSSAMQNAAQINSERIIGKQRGVWKVGDNHIPQIAHEKTGNTYELLTKKEFNDDFLPWLRLNPQ